MDGVEGGRPTDVDGSRLSVLGDGDCSGSADDEVDVACVVVEADAGSTLLALAPW